MAWGWQRYVQRTPDLSFAPIPGLPNWRLLETRAVSRGRATGAVFLGIGDNAADPIKADALCQLLYSQQGTTLTLAIFTDIQCPNCRSLEAKLDRRKDQLELNRIELPLLGPRSETFARANIGRRLGVGQDSPAVTARLARNHAAAETLGIWGTPAMTIGKTLVMGDVPDHTLDALLAMEHPACR